MLNIAFIRQRYVPDGGAERILQRTIAALRERKLALTVIAREWDAAPGVNIIPWRGHWLTRVGRDRGFARFACEQVDAGKFDVVQSHERIACCDIYRAGDGVHAEWLRQRARGRGLPESSATPASSYHRYLLETEKALFASDRLKAVICNSEMVRREIREHFHTPWEKLHLIYNGIDLHRYSPALRERRAHGLERLGIPDSAFVFLFVGSGFERKGLRQVLTAFAAMPSEGYLVIVGRDRNAGAYRRLTKQLGIDQKVRFVGVVEDVSTYYGIADAVLLPTWYDPFPNVCTEAFACGVPVITSYKCGAAELIREGENGHVCDAFDVECLKEKLRECVGYGHAHYTRAARATVKDFTPNNMVQKMIDLYSSLVPDKQ